MNLGAQWTTFLIALLGALIPVLPLAIGVLKTYLRTVENKMLILQRPTESTVSALFHQKLSEVGLIGEPYDDTTGHAVRRTGPDAPD